MDVKDLNKSQLILLALLLSFVTSLATGITTVTLMQQAPVSVTAPITKVIRQTVEKVSPADVAPALTDQEKDLLERLKSMEYISATVILKGEKEDKVLGKGFFLGNDKVIVNSVIDAPKEGETYAVKTVLGEQKILKMKSGDSYTVIELEKEEKTAGETEAVDNNPNPI